MEKGSGVFKERRGQMKPAKKYLCRITEGYGHEEIEISCRVITLEEALTMFKELKKKETISFTITK